MYLRQLQFAVLATLAATSSAISAEEYPTQVLWGDTHNHTGFSFDVYLFGTPNSTPDTAYRFAKGEAVINPTTGTIWQLSRPLDFLVVADHSEMLGSMPRLFEEKAEDLASTKSGKAMLEMAPEKTEDQLLEVYSAVNYVASNEPNDLGITPEEMVNDLHGARAIRCRTALWSALEREAVLAA